MHMTCLNRSSSAITAALALLLISGVTGCKSAPSAPGDSAQNPATQAGGAPNATPNGAASPAGNGSTGSGSAASTQTPPKPIKVKLTVEPGTDVRVRITETINSKTANVGDPFSGVLTTALATRSGETVFAKGTSASGKVVAAKGQGRFAGAGVLAIELNEVGGHPVTATEYVVSKKGKGKRSAALIGGGAGGGALIGALAGGGKGALIGSLIGGGAGTAGAGLTGNKPFVIPSESMVDFELSQPLSITVER